MSGVRPVAVRFLLKEQNQHHRGVCTAPVEYFPDSHYIEGKERGKKTSKLQHVTEITIPGMVSDIKITLKFHVALL